MAQDVLAVIKKEKLISIMRGLSPEYIVPTIQALYDGGIRCVEITIDHSSPQAIANTAVSIGIAVEKFADKMQIGAGTVLTPQEVIMVKEVGAQYIISPNTKQAVIEETKKQKLLSLPGAMTPSEIAAAYEWGADIVKVFPAGDLGPNYFKSLRGPLGHIPLMAVGGVNIDNLTDFFKAGAIGAGIGGNLVNVQVIKEGNFTAITEAAKKYVALV